MVVNKQMNKFQKQAKKFYTQLSKAGWNQKHLSYQEGGI